MKMNKLKRLTIFGVEQTFKNKFWIILNILMLLASIVYINFGTIKEIIDTKSGNKDEGLLKVIVSDETGLFEEKFLKVKPAKTEIVNSTDEEKDTSCTVEIKYDTESYIHAKVTSKEYIDMSKYSVIESVINEVRDEVFAKRNNISISDVEKVSKKVEIERIITSLDKELFDKYSSAFLIASMIIYMLFIFISSSLASTIGMEKVSRTTEYMLTGISENAYLWYNILQTNIVVILQSLLSIIYMIVSTLINSALKVVFLGQSISLSNSLVSGNIPSIALEPQLMYAIVIFLAQVVFSVLILSIIQAVLSSRVNNISDISNSTVVVLFFVIFATVIFPNFIPTGEAVNVFLKIVSILPVISAVAVPKLILLGQISNIGIILSVVISIVSIVLLTIFGSKAFKKGLLSTSKGSKKEERTDKVKEDDFNETKFKNTLSKVAMSLIIYLVFSNVIGIIASFISTNLSEVLKSVIQIFSWVISIYPAYWYLKSSDPSCKEKNAKNKMSIGKIILMLFIAFGIIWVVQFALEKIDNSNSITDLVKFDCSSVIGCTLLIVYVAVLPAIFEELLFRKAIFGLLRKYGFCIATIISSFAFGLVHQNLSQGIFAFLVGIVFCFVNEKSGKVYTSMILHFINNLIGAIQMIMLNKFGEEEMTKSFANIDLVLNIAAIISILLVIVYLIIYKLKKKKILELEAPKLKVNKPIKAICTDFVTILTFSIYVIITICITQLL